MRPWSVRAVNAASSPLRLASWWLYQQSHPRLRDALLVSVPSSGTHWLRTMLAAALIEAYHLPDSVDSIRQPDLIPEFLVKSQRYKYNGDRDKIRIQHTHSAYFFLCGGRRTLLLVRDLRDVMVSHYKWHVRRFGLDVPFARYLRGEGIDTSRHHTLASRIALTNGWLAQRSHFPAFRLVRYEDLQSRTHAELAEILAFLDMPALDEAAMARVVATGDRKNMEQLEASNPLPQYKNLNKVGEGKTGLYRDYFDAEARAIFLEIVRAQMPDTLGYDYETWD